LGAQAVDFDGEGLTAEIDEGLVRKFEGRRCEVHP
jgi:hypothetical protein